MPFDIIGRTGPRMRQIVGFGDRSTGGNTFGGEFGARHCNQRGLYGVRVRQRRDVVLFPNYFRQTCSVLATVSCSAWSLTPVCRGINSFSERSPFVKSSFSFVCQVPIEDATLAVSCVSLCLVLV